MAETARKRAEVGKSGKMVARVLITSYALPDGLKFSLKHVENCPNEGRDDEVWRFVEKANPSVVSELEVVLRGAMLTIGCDGCGVNKECSAGILFNHSQDSEYIPSQTQGTESYVSVMSPTSSAPSSWGASTILGHLPPSERELYKKFKEDRSSDEDYQPHKPANKEVAMMMDDGKTTEGNGIGDSKHASVEVPASAVPVRRMWKRTTDVADGIEPSPVEETQLSLPSTVAYNRSSVELLMHAIGEIENGNSVRAVENPMMDMAVDELPEVESVLWDHDKIIRLENAMEEERDIIARMRDIIEDLEVNVKDLLTWKKTVDEDGCNRCQSREWKGEYIPEVPTTSREKSTIATGPRAPVPRAVERLKPVPVVPVITAAVPTYKQEVGTFSNEKKSWGETTKSGDKDGFTMVVGNASKKKVNKSVAPGIVKRDVAPEKERHLKVRFIKERGKVHGLPEGITVDMVRNVLNGTLEGLNVDAYFAKAGRNKWGDIELTLARTKAEDLLTAGQAMTDALQGLGLKDFTFVRDTKKVKIYVAMVPLVKGGYGTNWDPKDWQDDNSFDGLAADIERSNPGIYVCARPSWVGKLHAMKSRKQSTAGLTILVEETRELKGAMAAREPKILVGGRRRFCRVWRERSDTMVCDKCLMVGHSLPECKLDQKCRWCRKNHMSGDHKCPIIDCPAPKGVACTHCRKWCILCEGADHYTGYKECPVLTSRRSTPPRYGPATPIEADNTSREGVNDRSWNRFKNTRPTARKTPVDEQVRDNEAKGDRTTRPNTTVKSLRSLSAPPRRTNETGGVEDNVTLSQW